MTVQFDIRDHEWPKDADGCRLPPAHMFLHISNANAADFFQWIGLPQAAIWGEISAGDLKGILRRRLWPERRDANDPGYASRFYPAGPGAGFIDCGRPPGRLRQYAERLLALAEYAGPDDTIVWS